MFRSICLTKAVSHPRMIGLSGEQEEEMMIEAYRYFTLRAVSRAAAYG